MTKHVNFNELGKKAKVIPMTDGMTLAEVLAAASANVDTTGSKLMQNGRRASPSDQAKAGAHVMFAPDAAHG